MSAWYCPDCLWKFDGPGECGRCHVQVVRVDDDLVEDDDATCIGCALPQYAAPHRCVSA